MKATKLDFNHKKEITFLPSSPMLGIQLINGEILCSDDEYRSVIGFKLGLFFITVEYAHVIWK